ncbi:MAG: endonuclease MutS2, partial [Candidatus Dormibacteraeota bacterium]|nr:endonuclease MutS2 [Candidatus Dormibacteraeota bacterium]
MRDATLDVLEYPRILDQVAAHTSFSVGRERILGLRPVTGLQEAEALQEETADAGALLEERPRAGVGGVRDVRTSVSRAARGGVLTAEQLGDVLSTLRAIAAVQGLLGALDPERLATLHRLESRLPDLEEPEGRLERLIDDESRVRNSASPRLAQVRTALGQQNQRLQERLRTLVSEHRSALQEPIVTMRGGRYVVPVRAEAQGQVRGIVHDQSASGATVYIEPMAIVELNNRLRQLEADERAEIDRLLRIASEDVGQYRAAITEGVEALGELDARLARARIATAWRAARPRLNRERRIVLEGARHPLLGENVVPIDF